MCFGTSRTESAEAYSFGTSWDKKPCCYDVLMRYRQPGLLCTPQNFTQSSKFSGKKYFWY
jgi:hypothetical protein